MSRQNHSVSALRCQKCSKITFSTFFFNLLSKSSRCIQMVQNWCRTVLWTSEHDFQPPNMSRSHFWAFLKNRFLDLKNRFFRLHPHKSMKKRVFERRGVPNIFVNMLIYAERRQGTKDNDHIRKMIERIFNIRLTF